jgi:hypothetical protein
LLFELKKNNPLIIINLLEFLIKFILFGDFGFDILYYCSESIFPFIISEQQNYYKIVQKIINEEQDLILKERLTLAFNNFTNNLNTNSIINFDRTSISQFNKNLEQFLTNVKSFLLKK